MTETPTIAELLADPFETAALLYDDQEVFEQLNLSDMKAVYKMMKAHKPRPEKKKDHIWICDWLKETLDAAEIDFAAAIRAKMNAPAAVPTPIEPTTITPTDLNSDFTSGPENPNFVGDAAEVEPPFNIDFIEHLVDKNVEAAVDQVMTDTFGDNSGITTIPVEGPEEEELVQVVSSAVARQVAERSCILEFYQSEPTFKKKVSASSILDSSSEAGIAGIDPTRLSVSKALIETAELRELLMHRRRFNRALKQLSLPGGLLTLAGGQYLIPLALINEVKANIDQYIITRGELLERFGERYPSIIEHAKEKLGDLFDETDYPEFHLIRMAYTVQYKFVSNSVPEELKKVSDQLYKQESKRVLADCAGAAVEIEAALRKGFADLTEHLADRLSVDEATGRPRQLHSSVVDGVKQFIDTFQSMDLTGDAALGELVSQARSLIGGADADSVRSDPALREKLQQGFAKIQESASSLVETRKRKVILE